MSGAEIAFVSSDFDIFAHRRIQTCVLGTVVNLYKPIDPVDPKDLEFFIPSDKYTFLD